jgi:hypothetical protein
MQSKKHCLKLENGNILHKIELTTPQIESPGDQSQLKERSFVGDWKREEEHKRAPTPSLISTRKKSYSPVATEMP